MLWNANDDNFKHQISEQNNDIHITKSKWLSKVAALFDLLRLLSPFTIRARILIQKMWLKGYNWDEYIQNEIKVECELWLKDLFELKQIEIPRWLGMHENVKSP